MREIGNIAQDFSAVVRLSPLPWQSEPQCNSFCLSASHSGAVPTVKTVKRCGDGVKWVLNWCSFIFLNSDIPRY